MGTGVELLPYGCGTAYTSSVCAQINVPFVPSLPCRLRACTHPAQDPQERRALQVRHQHPGHARAVVTYRMHRTMWDQGLPRLVAKTERGMKGRIERAKARECGGVGTRTRRKRRELHTGSSNICAASCGEALIWRLGTRCPSHPWCSQLILFTGLCPSDAGPAILYQNRYCMLKGD